MWILVNTAGRRTESKWKIGFKTRTARERTSRHSTGWWARAHLSCCSVTQSCLTLATPWNAAHQASLSFTVSWSLLKLVSIESVMPSNHLILCRPLLLLPSIFPSIRGQSTGASTLVPPVNIQSWFPLGLTGWISLQSTGLSRVFSSTTVWKHQFSDAQASFWSSSHIHTWLLAKP